MTKPKILITGAAGRIGTLCAQQLPSEKYDFVLADILPLGYETDSPFIQLDISDLEAFTAACEGVHTVIHMAADHRIFAEWDTLLPSNVIGSYNVFEAAHRAGCKRVIYASSVHATTGYPSDVQTSPEMPSHPGNLYGATKVWGESVAQVYADQKNLSCLCLRIGWFADRNNREPIMKQHGISRIITHDDMIRLILACIEAPEDVRFGIFNGLSNNRYKWLDLTSTRAAIGYDPQDDSFVLKEQYEAEARGEKSE